MVLVHGAGANARPARYFQVSCAISAITVPGTFVLFTNRREGVTELGHVTRLELSLLECV